MRVKGLAHEHKAMFWPGLEPGPLDPESSALTMRLLCLPTPYRVFIITRNGTQVLVITPT